MPDNLTYTPGTGATLRTDDVGGVHYPVVKIDMGGDGATLPLSVTNPMPIGAVRRDADTAPVADGAMHALHSNGSGRLKVSVMPADVASTAGSITANGQNVAVEVSRAGTLSISMVATSLVGHNVSFEVSNDSTNGTDGNWYAVQALRSNANTVELVSGVLTATPAYMWRVNVGAYTWFRVRATAHTSGTAAYILAPSSLSSEGIPAAQVTATQPVSGSVTVSGTATTTPANPTSSAVNSAATTNATAVKTSAGTLYTIVASNTGAAAAFVKLYNKASAPTVGTDVPILTLPIPAGSAVEFDMGALGYRFATGIALAITNLAADSDTTAVAAAQVKVLTSYI